METCPLVAVIILTYNSEAIIERCLRSFVKINYPALFLLVVDNSSIDNTTKIVKDKFSQFELICAESNQGYTGGNNLGIEAALLKGCKYLLIINPDTVLQNTNFVAELIFNLESQPTVGIAGPRVFFRTTDSVQNTILFPPSFWRNTLHWVRYRWNPNFAHYSGNKVVSAEMLNGVCVLLRSDCLREIGIFDESLFMYIEDADLAYRARMRNWEINYYPIDSIVHEQKEEGYHDTSSVAALLKRNSAHYLVKTGRFADAASYCLISMLLALARRCFNIGRKSSLVYAEFFSYLAISFFKTLTKGFLGRRYVR